MGEGGRLSLLSLYELLDAEQLFPIPLRFGPDGEIWFCYPTIHGLSRTTYPMVTA